MTAPTDMERGATVITPASGTIARSGTITKGIAIGATTIDIAIAASIGSITGATATPSGMTDGTICSMAKRTGSRIGGTGNATRTSAVRAGTAEARRATSASRS